MRASRPPGPITTNTCGGSSWLQPKGRNSSKAVVRARRVPDSAANRGERRSLSTRPGSIADLTGVTCLSATACTAVGRINGPARVQTLIETWNGTTWKVVPSPNEGPAAAYNYLDGVSCVSARDCTAVGTYGNVSKTLIETWKGTAWKIVASPNGAHGTTVNVLFGVSCASTAMCSAVGNYGTLDRRKTLIELGTPAA